MPQRNYSRERTDVAKPNKRAVLPIGLEEYQEVSSDSVRFRAWLDSMIAAHLELFPGEIAEGYELYDTLPASRKLPEVRFRRIKLKARDQEGKQTVLTIASSAVMPFMTGLTVGEWSFSDPFLLTLTNCLCDIFLIRSVYCTLNSS